MGREPVSRNRRQTADNRWQTPNNQKNTTQVRESPRTIEPENREEAESQAALVCRSSGRCSTQDTILTAAACYPPGTTSIGRSCCCLGRRSSRPLLLLSRGAAGGCGIADHQPRAAGGWRARSCPAVSELKSEPGDKVAVDEPIAQIETDKVTIDVVSPEAGVIKKFVSQEGDTVTPGSKVALISKSDSSDTHVAPSEEKSGQEVSSPAAKETVDQKSKAETASEKPKIETETKEKSKVTYPPPKSSAFEPQLPPKERETRVPMPRLRKRIAARLKDSQNTFAMLTTFNEPNRHMVVTEPPGNQEERSTDKGLRHRSHLDSEPKSEASPSRNRMKMRATDEKASMEKSPETGLASLKMLAS
ncbi:hypothetical protein KSP40_PGU004983 [Platanthera guangdongensis]|uniref:Lipoyl-binding domain-containing protein n=1 Tax=Platanthera guangdongensis TaxID=2320717 RepID=A0ABR2MDP0_9ASPA